MITKFLGIGTTHSEYEEVNALLHGFKPSAITLENRIAGILKKEPTRAKTVRLSDGCWLVFGKNSFDSYFTLSGNGNQKYIFATTPDMRAAIDYSIEKAKPFFFIDWQSGYPDSFVEFSDRKSQLIQLEKPSYLKFPDEYSIADGKPLVCMNQVNARNRFMADIINTLFQKYESIAHIAGGGHFNSGYSGSVFGIPFMLSKECELQNLVMSTEKMIIDLGSRTEFY